MPASPLSRRYVLYALGILFLVNLVNQLDRNILASLLPLIQKEYEVSDQWVGLLGSSFIWVFMISAVPFGYWADRSSRTRIMAGGLATWSAATFVSGLVPNFASLFACRALVGIGEAGYTASAPSMISDYFPPRQRGRAISVFFAAGPLGAGLGFALGGWLGQTVGWREAFFFAAAPGLALTTLAFLLREPARGAHDSSDEVHELTMQQSLRRLWRIRSYLWVVACGTLVTFAIGGVAVWLPTYLVRTYPMDLARAGLLSGSTLMIGSLGGTLAGSVFAEWLGRRTKNAQTITIASSLLVTAALLPVFIGAKDEAMLTPLLLVIDFFLFFHIGPINTLIANVSPPNIRGMAVSMQILTIHLLGDAFSPALIGAASDMLQQRGVGEAAALQSVLMVLLPAPVLLAAVCAAIAGIWAPRDVHRIVGDLNAIPPAVAH